MRDADDFVEGSRLKLDVFPSRGLLDGSTSIRWNERADRRVVEEPFSIGLRSTGEPEYWWKAGADEQHGKITLRGAMHCHDQRAELGFVQILELVDNEGHRCIPRLGRVAERNEQLCKVGI